MTEMRDRFCKVHDSSDTGIVARVNHFWKSFKLIDSELWFKFDKNGVQPYIFGFRWFMVLMAQEMTIEKTAKLWDTLFSDPFRFDFLNYFAISTLR